MPYEALLHLTRLHQRGTRSCRPLPEALPAAELRCAARGRYLRGVCMCVRVCVLCVFECLCMCVHVRVCVCMCVCVCVPEVLPAAELWCAARGC